MEARPDDGGDRSPFERRAEPSPEARAAAQALLAELTSAGARREATARVDDGEQVIDVAVSADGRWRVHASMFEWALTADGLRSWYVGLAGARERPVTEPEGWTHPAVGLLRPELLPVWGRPGDRFQPVGIVSGASGPGLLDLAPMAGEVVGGFHLDHGATLYVDATRLLVTCLELADRAWTLADYREA